jgi:hypothetical protein
MVALVMDDMAITDMAADVAITDVITATHPAYQ